MSISEYMDRAFREIDGFNVYSNSSPAEKRNKTYGEILPKGMDELCEMIKFEDDDYFVDLGSGVGKLAMRVFLSKPSGIKSKGIEISRQRHDMAMKAWSRLQKEGIRGIDNLSYSHDDIKNITN